MHCGIYGIYAENAGKWYFGQSRDIASRIAGHQRDFVAGRHRNRLLSELYHTDTLSYHIVELLPTDRLNDREHYWIQKYGGAGSAVLLNLHVGYFKHRPTYFERMALVNKHLGYIATL